MENFKFDDFVSSTIPDCYLTNSLLVKEKVLQIYPDAFICDIFPIGIYLENEILYEWCTIAEKNNHHLLMRFPIYLPENQKKAVKQAEKHTRIQSFENVIARRLGADDYFLINYQYPCQLMCDEQKNLYIKRFEMFASQKITQGVMRKLLNNETITATMAIIEFHTLAAKGLHDVGWMLNINGDLNFVTIDKVTPALGFYFMDNFNELKENDSFYLNRQKYVVCCDNENGLYLSKS